MSEQKRKLATWMLADLAEDYRTLPVLSVARRLNFEAWVVVYSLKHGLRPRGR